MKLTTTQIRAVQTRGNRELRYPYTADIPDLGPGEKASLDTPNGRTLMWVEIRCAGRPGCPCGGLGSYADDTTQEVVYEYRRAIPPDMPRLLTPAGRPKGTELGYTDKPYLSMLDEPEAVDHATQDRITLEAIGRHAKRRREQSVAARRERELLGVLERMDLARQAAARNGVSVHHELKAVRHMQKRGRSDGLIVAELERVERIAYKEAA